MNYVYCDGVSMFNKTQVEFQALQNAFSTRLLLEIFQALRLFELCIS